jgi:hypothetical protein
MKHVQDNARCLPTFSRFWNVTADEWQTFTKPHFTAYYYNNPMHSHTYEMHTSPAIVPSSTNATQTDYVQ